MDASLKSILNTVPKRVQHWGNTHPEEPAFIFWGPTGRFVLSRGELLDLSTRFATRLINRGVTPGDVICVLLPNSPERLVVDFGIQFAGAIPFNGYIALVGERREKSDYFRVLVHRAKCKMMVVNPNWETEEFQICMDLLKLEKTENLFEDVARNDLPHLRGVVYANSRKPEMTFLKSLESETMTAAVFTAEPSDIGYMFTSSGSTGIPKALSHTHKSLLSMSRAITCYVDKVCATGHVGWNGCYPFSFVNLGCCVVLFDLSNGPIADRVRSLWNMMATENVKIALLPSSQLPVIYEQRDIWQNSNFKLQSIVSGGQTPKRSEFAAIGNLTESLLYVYGCSELGAMTMATITRSNVDQADDGIAGFPFTGAEVKIEFKATGVTSDPKRQKIGEILVRSTSPCQDKDPAVTSKFTDDGWYKTGDAGYIREDGCLFVLGRIIQAIIQDGEMILPVFLEQKLVQCPGVKEAIVVPVLGNDGKQEICACVRSSNGGTISSQIVFEFCGDKRNAGILLDHPPKHVLVFEEFPLNTAQKHDRRVIVELARSRIGN